MNQRGVEEGGWNGQVEKPIDLLFFCDSEQIVGDAEANALIKRHYRDGHWAVTRGV